MEKINVAELLSNCPSGMELDCTIFDGKVILESINIEDDFPITIRLSNGNLECLTKIGGFTHEDLAKCVIFPKGKTTWEGFVQPCQFKDGDIIFTHANCLKVGLGNTWISIFQEKRNGGVATHVDYAEDGDGFYSYNEDKGLLCMEEDVMRQRFASEEEKAKLFQAIKDNGYKWNEETKTLEKLVEPKFKVGDKVRFKNDKTVITITGIKGNYYLIQYYNTSKCNYQNEKISFKLQDKYELVPNKFNITALKPFESRVLVRAESGNLWKPAIFGCYVEDKYAPYYVLGGTCWSQCIPYEGNEHLRGKTDDCDEYFKTWK